jgi:hypothetical protein
MQRCGVTKPAGKTTYPCMATLTEVFPCFFHSCKANARVKPAKTGHGPHSSKFLCCSVYFLCCSMYCLSCEVLCIVCVYMCTELLPPGGYPIVVKYIIYAIYLYIMSHHIILYHIIYHFISHLIIYHIYIISHHIIHHIIYHIIYHQQLKTAYETTIVLGEEMELIPDRSR